MFVILISVVISQLLVNIWMFYAKVSFVLIHVLVHLLTSKPAPGRELLRGHAPHPGQRA